MMMMQINASVRDWWGLRLLRRRYDFRSRAGRLEFLACHLMALLEVLALAYLHDTIMQALKLNSGDPLLVLFGLAGLALITAMLMAAYVRRMRDTGYPWWFAFFILIPVVQLWVFFRLALDPSGVYQEQTEP